MSEIVMSQDDRRLSPRQSDTFDDCGAVPPVENILSIENVSETFGVSQWFLRCCEFRGLIRRRNRISNVSVYSWADCDRIAFIIKCRRAGLRFSEFGPIVRAADDDSARVHEIGQEMCMALVQKLEARRKAIDEALSELHHTHSLLGTRYSNDNRR